METIGEEVTKAPLDCLEKAKKADKPFFLWGNSTRIHIFNGNELDEQNSAWQQ
jgi:hypothetical protein